MAQCDQMLEATEKKSGNGQIRAFMKNPLKF